MRRGFAHRHDASKDRRSGRDGSFGATVRTDRLLGLPTNVRACLFDLDGVLTETAKVHAAAWKEMFDAYLKTRADNSGEPFVAQEPQNP